MIIKLMILFIFLFDLCQLIMYFDVIKVKLMEKLFKKNYIKIKKWLIKGKFMDYEVLDKARINIDDLYLYEFIKKNFESENIKIALLVDNTSRNLGYFIEVRRIKIC